MLPMLAVLYDVPVPIGDVDAGDTAAYTMPNSSPSRAAKRTKIRTQGRLNDYEIRRAVELHAEDRAVQLFSDEGWEVERVGSRRLGYDLRCEKAGRSLHVEVKGTQSLGEEVILTRNEVSHGDTCEAEHCLFVVSEIEVERRTGITCQGGRALVLRPWVPASRDLLPSEFIYRVPRRLLME